jgi:hypothetical protein
MTAMAVALSSSASSSQWTVGGDIEEVKPRAFDDDGPMFEGARPKAEAISSRR